METFLIAWLYLSCVVLGLLLHRQGLLERAFQGTLDEYLIFGPMAPVLVVPLAIVAFVPKVFGYEETPNGFRLGARNWALFVVKKNNKRRIRLYWNRREDITGERNHKDGIYMDRLVIW